MSHAMTFVSWLPALAELPNSSEVALGGLIGQLIGDCLLVFGVVSIIKAFTKRTTGWIICGSISGLLIGTCVSLFTFGTGLSTPVVGKAVPYRIDRPMGWAVKRGLGDYDAVLNGKRAYVAIIAEKTNIASNEALARLARQRFASKAPETSFGNDENAVLDGRTWITFTARARAQNQFFVYRYYVYAGKEGAIQLTGWASQNDWDHEAPTLDRVMHTLHLSPSDAVPKL